MENPGYIGDCPIFCNLETHFWGICQPWLITGIVFSDGLKPMFLLCFLDILDGVRANPIACEPWPWRCCKRSPEMRPETRKWMGSERWRGGHLRVMLAMGRHHPWTHVHHAQNICIYIIWYMIYNFISVISMDQLVWFNVVRTIWKIGHILDHEGWGWFRASDDFVVFSSPSFWVNNLRTQPPGWCMRLFILWF